MIKQFYFKQLNLAKSYFDLSLNVTQCNLAHRYDPVRGYCFGLDETWDRVQLSGTTHSPILQHFWSLAIRLFYAKSRTLIWFFLPLCKDAIGVFYSLGGLGCINILDCFELKKLIGYNFNIRKV